MHEYQRQELAELALRWTTATAEATAALYAEPLDMSTWQATAETEQTARREFWEALYRIEVEQGSANVRKVPQSRRKGPKPDSP